MEHVNRKSAMRGPQGLAAALAAVMAIAIGGCKQEIKPVEASTIAHYIDPAGLGRIHRVAFIPLRSSGDNEGVARGMSDALFQSLQSRRLFQIDMVDPADPALEKLQLDGQPWTLAQMSALRQALQCDAVLLGAVTDFQPYPRIMMGLRLRLLDLKRGKLVWGVDQVWDTTNWQVLDRVKEYYEHRMSKTVQPLEWRLVTMSPNAFEQFVACEAAETLPNYGPAPKKPGIKEAAEALCE